MTVLAVMIYVGGVAGTRRAGASWFDAITWPGDLGYALGSWAWRNGTDNA